MAQHRSSRLAEEIKKEVSQLIRDEIKDPRVGFVTLTSVEVTNDLRHARIFVSTLGTMEEQKATLMALNKAKGFIRSELGKRVRLRYTPELSFVFDTSIEHGAKILELLTKVGNSEEVEKSE